MVITKQVKMVPTAEQAKLIDVTMAEYISLVNDIVDYAIALGKMPKLSSASVHAPLPSALRDQCRLDAKSIWKKTMKHGGRFPTLRKPVAYWNNQNYVIGMDSISFPMWVSGKSKRVVVSAVIPKGDFELLQKSKLGAMRITKKNGKYIAQIAYEAVEIPASGQSDRMGVDLGVKCPAVAVMDDETVRFYGNGRQRRQVRRHYAKRRKQLGKAKKLRAIKKSDNKEQRWMRDQDHKISRAIVNDAITHHVGVIKLEELSGIRSTRKSRKNKRKGEKNRNSTDSWSFYRLAQFIEYKAKLAGIDVMHVNPAYTSQTCPICGGRSHANDRTFECPDCGYRGHRDVVGARNILAA